MPKSLEMPSNPVDLAQWFQSFHKSIHRTWRHPKGRWGLSQHLFIRCQYPQYPKGWRAEFATHCRGWDPKAGRIEICWNPALKLPKGYLLVQKDKDETHKSWGKKELPWHSVELVPWERFFGPGAV